MSVMIVTSLGDIVVDLFTEKCPLTCKNFLKLCKIKYYNGCLFHTVQKDFTAQTGDPTGTGTGGDSIYKFLYGDQARFFSDEIHLDLKHSKTGTIAMASAGENLNASQFYFTLRDDLDYLDGKHTVFGELAEGLETLTRINEAYVDDKSRPYKNIRIKHTYILDDPFDDPPQLAEMIPDASPEGKPKDEVDNEVRLEDDWVPIDEQLAPGELEELIREKEARSNAVVLESIGDIPDADVKPPENVLFVCKLNPVTEDEDLHTIFSRFGTVTSAEIIRDYKTGDSLCYAFIEFESKDSCEQAYFKMDNALIDDRRIHVDFSQSVSKLWNQFRRGSNQKGTGRGCFKCGALDHLAKDCTGAPGQPPKYILKDTNMQHGGDNSRYEMVFDDDAPQSPRPRKKQERYDKDDQVEKPRSHKRSSDDHKYRDHEMKDSTDRHVRSDRSREQREVDRHRESKASQYREDQVDRRKHSDRRKEVEQDDERRDDRDHRKRNADTGYGDRRENGSYRKRTDDDDGREDRRDRRDYEKKSGNGDYRKKYADDDSHRRDVRDDRDHKRRREDDERRDSRDGRSYRKYDDHKGRREDRDDKRRGLER